MFSHRTDKNTYKTVSIRYKTRDTHFENNL